MSILRVNSLDTRTGTDISIITGKTITGTASQFKITGGTAGQAILTDGSGGLTFGAVDALPTQSGQAGEYLQTDGTTASWEPINLSGATEHGFSYINAAQTFAASLRALIDTTASALSFNMPASPTLGDTIRCADAAGTMATNYATINGNGNTFTTAAGATDPQFIINTN